MSNLFKTLEVDILHHWGHETEIGLDGEGHIHVMVLPYEVTHPGTVAGGHLDASLGSGLHNNVVH